MDGTRLLRGTLIGSAQFDAFVSNGPSDRLVELLTASERRALELFASGMPRSEIAQVLNRAPKTISNSLTAARDKLGARSLAEAAALWAVESAALASKASA
jgi:DNA-binding CsgD family transcriptional regulator